MLKELCQSVNIEKTAVCLVQEGIGEPSLKPLLKQIIRGSKFIELAA